MKELKTRLVSALYLLVCPSTLLHTQAAFIDPKYAVNQKPRSSDHAERSAMEAPMLVGRQAIPSCGDAAGNQVDLQELVTSSVAAGLPHASDTGVVFMEAAVTGLDGCGPYTCYVSSDASGTSWSNMVMLQNVPQLSEGCGTTDAQDAYTVVASFPDGTTCTGLGGACLIMCKAQAMPLGNCAAVAWENTTMSSASSTTSTSISSSSTSSSYISSNTTTSSVHTIQSQSTTQVTSASGTVMLPASSSTSTTTSSTDAVKAAFTLRGFSGNEGPGGPAEQHLNFGQGTSSKSMGLITSTSGSASARQAGEVLGALILSTLVAWAFA